MKSIHFILGIHNHQPVGNFDHIFEEAYQKSYLPFLQILQEFPTLRINYHTTGPLYDWLEIHHPEYFDLLSHLLKNGQLEMMTGGYQEPILPIIPDRDKTGQIRMMTDYLRRKLNAEARGMWLAERVWEPHLAKPLCECGVEYVTLDDYHFFSAGLDPASLLGYYRTDEQGYGVFIFPISKKLRYLIPFSQPEEALQYLRDNADESGENLLVMADDGEKFGLWPGTYDRVYTQGWLRRFFQTLQSAQSEGWLKITTCSEYTDRYAPRGRVYLPCASYFEMSTWSLPADSGARFDEIVHRYEKEGRLEELRPFLKGGFWRGFLAKYDESNRMYRKMLWISNKIAELETTQSDPSGKRKQHLVSARLHLYRAQCNCAYWHGVFGGLYLPHLRHAIYQNLLLAERFCNEIEHSHEKFCELLQSDFNADGGDELYLRNEIIGILFSPKEGGCAYELDYLPASFNLLNTLRRQPEAYHRKVSAAGREVREGESIHDQFLAKESGLERYLVYDRHTRGMFIDHFLCAEESPQSLLEGRYHELGDFVGKPYNICRDPYLKGNTVVLERSGRVVDNIITLRKEISLLEKHAGIAAEYRLYNQSSIPLTILFAPEFNFALLGGDSIRDYFYETDRGEKYALNTVGVLPDLRKLFLCDMNDGFSIFFDFDTDTEVWHYPCETISLSEGGFERVYQSSCVLPVYRLSAPPLSEFRVNFRLRITSLRQPAHRSSQ